MKGKIGALTALGLGVLLIAAGLIVKFVVVPAFAVFPDDVDATRTYEGTLEVMLNPEAIATGDLGNVFLTNLPVNINRHVTTEATDGGKALVLEDADVLIAGQLSDLLSGDSWYTIDRRTMDHVPNFTDNSAVDNNRQGLVIGFPIGTEKRTYEGWSDYFQGLQDIKFVAEEERHGWDLYHFRARSNTAPIVDPETLAMFPPAFPKDVVLALAPTLAPPELLGMLQQFAPALPDPVPFSYLYEYETNYWVDPATGVLIDYTKDEAVVLAFESDQVPGGIVPVGPVLGLVYQHTADSIADAKEDADDGKGLLNIFGTIVPWSAVGLGAVLALFGGYFAFVKKEEDAAPAEAPAADEPLAEE